MTSVLWIKCIIFFQDSRFYFQSGLILEQIVSDKTVVELVTLHTPVSPNCFTITHHAQSSKVTTQCLPYKVASSS